MGVIDFSSDYLDSLAAAAYSSARQRQHRNVHNSFDDPCQRTFNALQVGTYLPPHRHLLAPKAETMIAVRGLMALLVFDDGGNVIGAYKFGAGRFADDPDVAVGVETPPGLWHKVVALESGSILFEVKAGPYDPTTPKETAPWAPEEGSEDAQAYLEILRKAVVAR